VDWGSPYRHNTVVLRGRLARHDPVVLYAISPLTLSIHPSVCPSVCLSVFLSGICRRRYTYGHQDGLWEYNTMRDSG